MDSCKENWKYKGKSWNLVLPFDLMLSCQFIDTELGIPYNYSLLALFDMKFLPQLKIAFGWNSFPCSVVVYSNLQCYQSFWCNSNFLYWSDVESCLLGAWCKVINDYFHYKYISWQFILKPTKKKLNLVWHLFQ